VLAWAVEPGERASWATPARLAADLWLVAHGAPVEVPGGTIALVPLGLLAGPLLACWFAGVRLARALDPRAEQVRSGLGRVRPVTPPRRSLAAFALTYGIVAGLVAVAAATPAARPGPVHAFVGGLIVAVAGVVPGAAAWRGRGAVAGLGVLVRTAGVPPILRDWARPAAGALAVHLGAATLLTLVATGFGWGRVAAVHGALDPGPAGGAALVLAQLLVVPDAVVWAAAYLAGPGFAVGTGTAVGPGATVLGPLPALPLFGALPVPGTNPGWVWGVLAVPVLAGVVAGVLVTRRAPRAPVTQWATDAVGAGAAAGVVLAVLAALAAGPAGPGRMAELGPSAWRVGLATALEVALGALAAVGAKAALRSR
jgi:hypothetical protein